MIFQHDAVKDRSDATIELHDPAYRRELGAGLVLRWSTAADETALGELYAQVFRRKPDGPPNDWIRAWNGDLMSGRHPLIGPDDFAVVEDQVTGRIVAATCLMRQGWEYGGIPLPVGRPEVVATEIPFRKHGLIRAIFELIHARSAARGDLVQGITGIPYYYRQFGYEFALELGSNVQVFLATIPRLKPDQPEAYRLRDARSDELDIVTELYAAERQRPPLLVTTCIDQDYWTFVSTEMSLGSGHRHRLQLITTADDDRVVGYIVTQTVRWETALEVNGFMLRPGVAFHSVVPAVLRALAVQVPDLRLRDPEGPPADRIRFWIAPDHPARGAMEESLTATTVRPYAWYVRVPDLPALIKRIAPALDRRLAASVMAGHTGELKLDFYRGGLHLAWDKGRLTTAEPWTRGPWDSPAAGFPPLVVLQLVFGYRSLAELRKIFPDVWAEDAPAILLDALFPPQPSWAIHLD